MLVWRKHLENLLKNVKTEKPVNLSPELSLWLSLDLFS